MTTNIVNKKRSEFTLLDNKESSAVCRLPSAVCIIIHEISPFGARAIALFKTILYQFYLIR
jgi:hypothetical protein